MSDTVSPSLSSPSHPVSRTPRHRRTFDVQVYEREDGLWELEARLVDVKQQDFVLVTGPRRAGEPIHDMTLSLLFDESLNVLDARSRTDHMPYPGQCDQHVEVYRRLIGLNFLRQFRQEVKARTGGTQGCTHLTEMAQVLPTAVVQALGSRLMSRDAPAGAPERRPFQIDRCHTLRVDGQAVREYFPRWYRPPVPGSDSHETAKESPS